ncbi:type II secretion system protein GspE [Candidatus Wolfebacteria bacterium CG03_land_8_20_14_0_80_40_12]|uniref:Type II secretion system protein GspE n=1 Tax=Candidatus Wolfebacteria bacterium CG03_land_8_20_14_0_80_40_12 TaxID=1975069 RepID=A0A2M7B5V8_9BACT|nr:MAG: type II secretion system protein GspE [Candidatus Wolfebacteria bacterium CG03_land_8_20_14_0_80_40_12]
MPKGKVEEELKRGSEVSIIDLVDSLIEHAYNSRASDIHIDPEEKRLRVRLRIDGVLHDAFIFPKEIQSEIITRIKVLSGLRTDEHQAAQDGRFRTIIKETSEPIDIRISIAPTYYGENAALRLLAEKAEKFTLETLGFSKKDLEKVMKAAKNPYGMILCTGPTGSGKTTTLYTILKILNTKEVSIITIEDPIEYSIEGIDQIQVNARTGLTFANGLRSILRQDPNIIMVGEIRDEETAAIAINAALTGHLLLSTLHTNDAATTLPRLLDMKIEPFLIASTVNVAIGQRLVRKICSDCKVKKTITDVEFKNLTEFLSPEILDEHRIFYKGEGCGKCENSGYFGRIGIHEVLEIDDNIRKTIIAKTDASEIQRIAVKNGMTTILEDGFKKALAGITTIEEVLRVIHE